MAENSSFKIPGFTQTSAFLSGEGDNWFKRSQGKITSPSVSNEVLTRTIGNSFFDIKNILEIGCSNGSHLYELSKTFDANCYGVDPSSLAISSGSVEYPSLHLSVGTGQDLNFSDESFDMVHFGFCLYLIDRTKVFQAVAEADRVLRSGGFLAITDFDPNFRHKRPYHHLQGLNSFKNSYSDFFTSGGHYYLVAKESFSHTSKHFALEDDERLSISVLFKEPDPYKR